MKNFFGNVKSYLTDPAFILSVLTIGLLLGGIFYRLVRKAPIIGPVVDKVAIFIVALTLAFSATSANAAENHFTSAPGLVATVGAPEILAGSIFTAIGAIAVAGIFIMRRNNHAGRRNRRTVAAAGACAVLFTSLCLFIPDARAEWITAKGGSYFFMNPKMIAGYTNAPNFGVPMPVRLISVNGTNGTGWDTNLNNVEVRLGTNYPGYSGILTYTNGLTGASNRLFFLHGILRSVDWTNTQTAFPATF